MPEPILSCLFQGHEGEPPPTCCRLCKQEDTGRGPAVSHELAGFAFIVLRFLLVIIFVLFFLSWAFSEVFAERCFAETLQT